MSKLVALGTMGLDIIKTPAGSVKEALGGAVTHFSVAASLFNSVNAISVVGYDFPEEHIEFLKSRNINVDGIEKTQDKTFRWSGSYEGDMNQAETLSIDVDILNNFQGNVPENYKDAEYIFLGNIDPELQLKVIKQMTAPKFIAMDTMNFWIENKKEQVLETLKNVNLLFINDAEARQLFETHNLKKAASRALDMGPDHVIIKKGEHGSILFSKDWHFSLPGYPLDDVVDPTGAGDSFAGGFMGWLAKTDDLSEKNLRKSMVYATMTASFNVQDFSINKLKNINMIDIQNRYNNFKNMTYFHD